MDHGFRAGTINNRPYCGAAFRSLYGAAMSSECMCLRRSLLRHSSRLCDSWRWLQ